MTTETVLRILNTVANYGTVFALVSLGWRDHARTRAMYRLVSKLSARADRDLGKSRDEEPSDKHE